METIEKPTNTTPADDVKDYRGKGITTTDIEKQILEQIRMHIPKEPVYDIKSSRKESSEKINNANKSAEDKLIDTYIRAENSKLSQQKPIAIFVLIIFTLQLIAFNALIFIIVSTSIKHFETSNFLEVINFLKYYIGAVVVELIALVTIIVRGSYTLNASSIVEQIIGKKNK